MTSNDNIGRVFDGKYEIIRVLGKGGMGEVYEANHQLIQRRLAIKILRAKYAEDAEMVERFAREAQTSAAIGHEHIVAITDMGMVDTGELFIVMEYLEGQDLESLLREQRPLPVKRACHIMIQVLSALEAAHAAGIVHRDLKPANVFLTTHAGVQDYAKIVDFGISKVRTSEMGEKKNLTKTGILLGTPSYMSPEQAVGQSDITFATDIFAAGVILYEMVTGQLPFEGSSMALVLSKILAETPPPPVELDPELPRTLSDAIMQAMEKEAGNRFDDAASMRREITPFSPLTDQQTGLATTRLKGRAAEFHGSVGRNRKDDTNPMRIGEDGKFATLPLTVVTTTSKRGAGSLKRRIAVLAVTAAIAISGLLLFLRFDGAEKVKSVPQVPVLITNESDPKNTPPPAERVEVRVEAIPKEAEIVIDGLIKGSGNYIGEFQKGEKKKEIVIRASGYKEHRQLVSLERTFSMVVTLEKMPAVKEASDVRKRGRSTGKTKSGSQKTIRVDKPEKPRKKNQSKARTIDEEAPW